MTRACLLLSVIALAACAGERSSAPTNPDFETPDFVAPAGYEVIDLGTLGGYTSYPFALNDAGQVVGQSEREPWGRTYAFLWEQGQMHDLQLLSSDFSGSASALSSTGKIAGIHNPTSATDVRVFGWSPLTPPPARTGVMSDLDAGRPISPGTRVVGINDDGDVLADVQSDLYGRHAMVWRGGVAQQLPGLEPDAETFPATWNALGQAVGTSHVYERGALYDYYSPVLWENGTVRDLGLLGPVTCPAPGPAQCGYGRATDINDSGAVVGWSNNSLGLPQAFLWNAGQLTGLNVFGDNVATWAWAINDRGQVAGDWGAPTGGFLWDNGAVSELGSLGGGGTRVWALSDAGEVVGSSLTASRVQRAFLWRDGQMINLGVGPMGGMGSLAFAINARGDILGVSGNCGWSPDGSCPMYGPFRAILWRKLGAPQP